MRDIGIPEAELVLFRQSPLVLPFSCTDIRPAAGLTSLGLLNARQLGFRSRSGSAFGLVIVCVVIGRFVARPVPLFLLR